MNNAELRGMLNELARLIVLSGAIPAQLVRRAQKIYHRLEMEASELPQKKICAMCAREDEEFEGNKYFRRSGISSAAEFSGTYKTAAGRGRRHRTNLPRNYYSAIRTTAAVAQSRRNYQGT